MIKLLFFVLLVFSTCVGAKNTDPSLASTIKSMNEMHRLVSPDSDTRTYLWCAVVSSKLGMNDVYSLFMHKAQKEAKDDLGMIMALPYMMGFVDSEIMNMDKKNAGEVLGTLYSTTCMKQLLPPKSK